jgi:hypothetical protein
LPELQADGLTTSTSKKVFGGAGRLELEWVKA